MATYAYKCSACGNAFEVKATIEEKEEAKNEKFSCPKCRSKSIKQEFSAVNFIKNVFKSDKKSDGRCSCGEARDSDNKSGEENSGDCCGGKTGGCC